MKFKDRIKQNVKMQVKEEVKNDAKRHWDEYKHLYCLGAGLTAGFIIFRRPKPVIVNTTINVVTDCEGLVK